mgnify:FL=1
MVSTLMMCAPYAAVRTLHALFAPAEVCKARALILRVRRNRALASPTPASTMRSFTTVPTQHPLARDWGLPVADLRTALRTPADPNPLHPGKSARSILKTCNDPHNTTPRSKKP